MAEDGAVAVVERGGSDGAVDSPAQTSGPLQGEAGAQPGASGEPTPGPPDVSRSQEARPTPDRSPPPTPARQPSREATPPAEVSPEPNPVDQARDTLIQNWRDLADPDYRADPVLGKYKTVGEALKGLVEGQRLLGNSIQIPREGAGDVQWRTIYEKLGCPKHPGEYTISDPAMGQDADGHAKSLAPNFVVSLLDVCHQAGLNNKQAQAFVDFAARKVVESEQIQAGEMAMQKAQAERQLFEAFAGDAATMIQKATMAISRMGEGRYGGGAYAQRAADKIRESALGNDVDVIAALANLWDNMSEGNFVESGAGGELTSKDQLQADIAALGAIMNDDAKPWDERVAAQRKQFQLFQSLNAMEEAAQRRQNGFRR